MKNISQLTDEELEFLLNNTNKPQLKSSKNPSKIESFARGALDTATLNFAPKIIGGVGSAILPFVRPDLFGDQSTGEIYKELRDTARGQQEEAAQANPWSSVAGNLVGGLPLPFPTKTVSGAAKLGGAYGIGQGLGKSDEGEIGELTPNDIIQSIFEGGIGSVAGGIGQKVANNFAPRKSIDKETEDLISIAKKYQIPITEAELTKNPNKLVEQELAVKGKLGERNFENLKNLKDAQKSNFKDAARGLRNELGQEEFISKGTAAADVANEIQEMASKEKKIYSDLYKQATKDVTKIDNDLLKAFSGDVIDEFENSALTFDNAPKAFRELDALNKILEKPDLNLNKIEAWKQGLNRSIREAPRGGQEEFALKKMSNSFDQYLDKVIDQILLEGDVSNLDKFKNARGLAAQWFDKYKAKNPQEFGKKFVEDIVENSTLSREPYTDEMIVNKILGVSELGFKKESSAIVKEIKNLLGTKGLNKIKLEATDRIINPLLKENPNVITYNNNLEKLLKNNKSLAQELFTPNEIKDLKNLGKFGKAIFNREKSVVNPSGTAELVIGYLEKQPWLRGLVSNIKNKKIETNQEKIFNTVMAGEKGSISDALTTKLGVGLKPKNSQVPKEEEYRPNLKEESQVENNLSTLSDEELEFLLSPSKENVINSNILEKIAKIESNNNPNAKNKYSSASGLFQFTDGTWKELVKNYGEELGISNKDKNNPEAQVLMASIFTQNNANDLSKFLGRQPTDGEVYLAHFLGSAGAKKFLSNKNQNQLAYKIMPAAAKANKNIFFKNGKPLTVEQVKNSIISKV